jgi:hypothetical protein
MSTCWCAGKAVAFEVEQPLRPPMRRVSGSAPALSPPAMSAAEAKQHRRSHTGAVSTDS